MYRSGFELPSLRNGIEADQPGVWPKLRQRKDAGERKRDAHGVTPARVMNMLVSDVLAVDSATAAVFVGHRMGCVGCTFARFETVGDVAGVYGLEPEDLARSLAEVLRAVKRAGK